MLSTARVGQVGVYTTILNFITVETLALSQLVLLALRQLCIPLFILGLSVGPLLRIFDRVHSGLPYPGLSSSRVDRIRIVLARANLIRRC